MSRKLKSREITRVLDGVLIRLNTIHARTGELCYRANTDMDEGFSSQALGGGSRSGHGDPVGSRIEVGRRDQTAAAATMFVEALRAIDREVRRLDKAAWMLEALSPDEARILSEKDEVAHKAEHQTISTVCQNPVCGKLIPETHQRKSGRCMACYMYRYRNAGLERPRELCALDTVDGALSADGLGLDMERVITEDVA